MVYIRDVKSSPKTVVYILYAVEVLGSVESTESQVFFRLATSS